MLRVQLGADTVENTETKPISIIGEQYQPSQNLRFELGDSKNAKLQDIISQTTAESLLKSACATVQSIQYGKFQTQNVNGQKFDARAVVIQLKSFSNIVEQIARDYPALGNTFTNDSKVQHFIYNISKANQLTTDDFETFRKSASDASSQIQAPSSEMVERVKNAVSWNSNLTLYVDRSLNIVGSGGSTSLGITKGELAKDSESLGLKIPLDAIQIDELCNLLCSGLTLSGSSFRANTVFMPPSKQTQSSDDFLQHINQNKQFTDLSSKFNKLLQNNNFDPSVLLPITPFGSNFTTSKPCLDYSYSYNTDGSVVCDYNFPLPVPTEGRGTSPTAEPAL